MFFRHHIFGVGEHIYGLGYKNVRRLLIILPPKKRQINIKIKI